jgi:type VI secretion system protein VasD
MSIVCFKPLASLALFGLLAGCGLGQSVSDSTAALGREVFFRPVTTVHLRLDAQALANTDQQYMNSLTVPTRVQVLQLADSQRLRAARYGQLLNDAPGVLQADLLAERTLTVQPGTELLLAEPLHPQAQAVAIVAWVREPDTGTQSWRLILPRAEWIRDQPRVIALGDNRLALQPLTEG